MRSVLIILWTCSSVFVCQAQDHRFGGEVWQGTNFVSLSSPITLAGYSRGLGLTYDYHKKGSAFSFGASIQVGAYRFRSANGLQIIVNSNQGYGGCLFSATYLFRARFFLGPGLFLQWLSVPDIHFKDTYSRVSLGRSEFIKGYGHVAFQPALVLQGAFALDQNAKFILKLLVIQHVSNLMSHDYMVDFLTTPPSPQLVLPANAKPVHLIFGFCYRPLRSKEKKQVE